MPDENGKSEGILVKALQDEGFLKLPVNRKAAVLSAADPDGFGSLPAQARIPLLLKALQQVQEGEKPEREGFIRNFFRGSLGVGSFEELKGLFNLGRDVLNVASPRATQISGEERQQSLENLGQVGKGILSTFTEPAKRGLSRIKGATTSTGVGGLPLGVPIITDPAEAMLGAGEVLQGATGPLGAVIGDVASKAGAGETSEALGLGSGVLTSFLIGGGLSSAKTGGGKALSKPLGGVRIPLAAGEASGGRIATLTNKLVEVLEGSSVGGPIRRFRTVQGQRVNQAIEGVVNRISRLSGGGTAGGGNTVIDTILGRGDSIRNRAISRYRFIESEADRIIPGKGGFGTAIPVKGKGVSEVAKDIVARQQFQELLAPITDIAGPLKRSIEQLSAGTAQRGLPFRAFQDTRSGLIAMRRRYIASGSRKNAGIAGSLIKELDDAIVNSFKNAGRMDLVREFRQANALFRRSVVMDNLAEAFSSSLPGTPERAQARAGLVPETRRFKANIVEKLSSMEDDLVAAFGREASDEILGIGEIIKRAENSGTLGGHLLTTGLVLQGAAVPLGGLAVAAPLGIDGIGGRLLSRALVTPSGRRILVKLLKSEVGSPDSFFWAARLVDAAIQSEERVQNRATLLRFQPPPQPESGQRKPFFLSEDVLGSGTAQPPQQ